MKCGELRPHVFPASNFTQLSGMNFPQATKVYKVVEEQVQQDEYAAATFARLSVQPNSQSRQVALAAILAELTEKDPDFVNLSHTHQVDCAIAPFNGGGVKNAIAKPLQNLLNAFFAAMSIVDFHFF